MIHATLDRFLGGVTRGRSYRSVRLEVSRELEWGPAKLFLVIHRKVKDRKATTQRIPIGDMDVTSLHALGTVLQRFTKLKVVE